MSSQDDLNLLAFQYLLGEMSPVEVTAWEDRLLTDQAAREAIAEVGKITHALQRIPQGDRSTIAPAVAESTSRVSPANTRRIFSRRVAWFIGGGIACVLALVSVNSWRVSVNLPRVQPESSQVAGASKTRVLAARWSLWRSTAGDELLDQPSEIGQGTIAADSALGEQLERWPDVADEETTPAWLLSAVTRGTM